MTKSYTPLRYPGGKQCLAPYIKQLIKINDVSDGFYAEPYAGGAGLAMDLLLSESIYSLYINDADFNIFAFWYSVLNEKKELIRKIEKTPVTIEEWEHQKSILRDKSNKDTLEKGFATFFLNRTNRSGILKAGPIGGKNQTGNYKIDARFNKEALISRIELISEYASRIHLYNLDALDFLKEIKPLAEQQKSLIYLDPPYYIHGRELYLNAYSHNDHAALEKYLSDEYANLNWLVSYDASPEIKQMYSSYRYNEYTLNYSVKNARKGTEYMFFSDSIKIPEENHLTA